MSQITYLKVSKICLYVIERYEVHDTVAGMRNWLKRHGFVYKHPKYLDHQTRIQIHDLPPYSPNLNAIERLWKVMRECTTYNKIYSRFNDFTEKIRDFFETGVFNLKDTLRKRINDNFQKIELNPLQTSIC